MNEIATVAALSRNDNRGDYFSVRSAVSVARGGPLVVEAVGDDFGNKRTGLVVCGVFLRLNGQRLTASQPELYAMVMAAASGEIDEEEIVEFVRANS